MSQDFHSDLANLLEHLKASVTQLNGQPDSAIGIGDTSASHMAVVDTLWRHQ